MFHDSVGICPARCRGFRRMILALSVGFVGLLFLHRVWVRMDRDARHSRGLVRGRLSCLNLCDEGKRAVRASVTIWSLPRERTGTREACSPGHRHRRRDTVTRALRSLTSPLHQK